MAGEDAGWWRGSALHREKAGNFCIGGRGIGRFTGFADGGCGFRACETIGLPECELNLAHVVIFLATCPKSNSATLAIGRAKRALSEKPVQPVPSSIRDRHGRNKKHRSEDEESYLYSHEFPENISGQKYLEDPLDLYLPKARGRRERSQALDSVGRKSGRSLPKKTTRSEQFVHQLGGLVIPAVATFAGSPALEIYFLEFVPDLVPFGVSFSERTETGLLPPVLDVELEGALAEDTYPFVTGGEFLHIPDIVVGLHPRAVNFVDIVPELLGFEAKAIPYGLDEDVDLELLAQGDAFADLLDRAGPDMLMGLVLSSDFSGD